MGFNSQLIRYDDTCFNVDAPTKILALIVCGFYVSLGIVEVTTENVQSLLQGASMLNLLALRNVCCQFLQQHLDASNCLGRSIENIETAEFVYIKSQWCAMSIKQDVFAGIQSFADMYSCTELESAARRYIYSHFLDAIQHEEFLQLSDERLIDLLKSDQLQVNTEEQVGVMYSHSVEQGPGRDELWQLGSVPTRSV